jgi:hypothetical protein
MQRRAARRIMAPGAFPQEKSMTLRDPRHPPAALALMLLPALAAAEGLVAPPADALWPQIQARIALQAGPVPRPSLFSPLEPAGPRAGGSAALLGDVVLAAPRFGSFRASGGVVLGHGGWGSESAGSQPYLGLGFTSATLLEGLSVTADLGWVSAQPRALFGDQGTRQALRDMRIAPVMQLGLRYAF